MKEDGIVVHRASERARTLTGWLDSSHSFSFGRHYDPANTRHGLLLVNNDDVVAPGGGFRAHPHRDMEIVTWVLDGELEHADTLGNRGVIYPGLAQRMSAGTGIWHSEMNAGVGAVHFVQMWVLPDTESAEPGYSQRDITSELDRGGLVPIAAGQGHDAAISIRQRGATIWGGRLRPGEQALVPSAPYAHVFIARGSAELERAGRLEAGDAARLTGAGSPALSAGEDGAEVLIWATD